MKKMFVTGMNMNETKAYVEPKMQVVEVDVQSFCDVTSGGYDINTPDIGVDDEVKEDKDLKWSKGSSIFDDMWK